MSSLINQASIITYTKVDLIFENLVYNQEFKTIICIICKYSLGLAPNITRHLKENHYIKEEFILVKTKLNLILNNLDLLNNNNLYIPFNNKYYFKNFINY